MGRGENNEVQPPAAGCPGRQLSRVLLKSVSVPQLCAVFFFLDTHLLLAKSHSNYAEEDVRITKYSLSPLVS